MTAAFALTARPGVPDAPPLPAGDHRIDDGGEHRIVLVVPSGVDDPPLPPPLVVCLHGAGARAVQRLDSLRAFAERYRVLLVGPESVGNTWDVIMGRPGPDVERIDAALTRVFRHFAVDPERIAVEGFSDGASYALTLGLANGDLFRRIFAFSPGFNAAPSITGQPKVLITHGRFDPVLPVACSRGIVHELRGSGVDVEYHEFRGLHNVPIRFPERAFATL